jgi:uncharacterized membrane-anchored protein
MSFTDHPLRSRVVNEMHMRRVPPVAPPSLMLQVVRLVAAADRDAEWQHAVAMPGVVRSTPPPRHNHLGARGLDGAEYAWERHSEATTGTLILPAAAGNPFETLESHADAVRWLADAPGLIIRAVKIGIVPDEATAEPLVAAIGFAAAELVSCRFGTARVWTDFLIYPDGFGRLLVAAGDTDPTDLARLVQRIQELGNYRNLALLGLPTAQEEAPKLGALENELVAITARMAAGEGDAGLLDQLCGLSANVTSTTAATAFRMSATAAYAQIVQDRLASLGGEAIAGFMTFEAFTDRRFRPAIRTCASFTARLDTLAVRIERATSLLRTRVEMTVQAQNVALLRSMEANASRQLRIQSLVESLSVVAVSYYAVGLAGYLFKAVPHTWGIPPEALIAASVLPAVALVALYMRRRMRALGV